MKKLFVFATSLFVFVVSSNAVTYKSGPVKNNVNGLSSKKKTENLQISKKVNSKIKQLDCDVTLDLSEECCDGSWYLNFCITHFCNPGGMTAECYAYGDLCPICPPQ